MKDKKVYICLEDGSVFEGKRFGAEGDALGELVFTTGMGGYMETLTDKCNYGQIVMQTFPLIGNYGCIDEDIQGKNSVLSAYIVREYCRHPSNFRCSRTLDEYLKEHNIVGVYDADTRELTKTLRNKGTVNAFITENPRSADFDKIKAYRITGAAKALSVTKPEMHPSDEHKFNVVLIDCGEKDSIISELNKLGCNVAVVPYNTKAQSILSLNPDGIVISNGAGDPADNADVIAEIKELAGKQPIFAIGLGHQLLALSQGAETYKMHHGHRGANQPVKDFETDRTFITAQNHGYAVSSDSVAGTGGNISFSNVNDGSCEGIEYENINAFSVQFCPEACEDTKFIYKKFTDKMGGSR